jgi:hypothetical protein
MDQVKITRKEFLLSLVGVCSLFVLNQLPFSSLLSSKKNDSPVEPASFGGGVYGGK